MAQCEPHHRADEMESLRLSMPEGRLQRTREQYRECPDSPNGEHVWARRRDGRRCAYCDKLEFGVDREGYRFDDPERPIRT